MATLAGTGIGRDYAGWQRHLPQRHCTGTTPFATLSPPGCWNALPATVRRRFERKAMVGAAITYAGEVVECRMNAVGWLLAQAARLVGAPLPLGRDNRPGCTQRLWPPHARPFRAAFPALRDPL